MPPEGSRAGRNYKQGFGSVHGFNPYAGRGYIPNFSTATSAGSMTSGFEQGKAGLAKKMEIPGKKGGDAIDLSNMFTMLTLQQAKGGSASVFPDSQYGIMGGAKGALPQIKFGVRGMKRSQVKGMAGSHDAFDVMRERLKDAVVPKGVEFGNNMQLGNADRTNDALMSKALSQGSSGALGALSGLVGAVFEAAISTRLPATDPKGAVGRLGSTKVGGDFDVRSISSSEELQMLFGGGIADIGDYKTSSNKETNKSMANKITKEMIYRKHPAFVGDETEGKGLYQEEFQKGQYRTAYGENKGASSGRLSDIKTLRSPFEEQIVNPGTKYLNSDTGEWTEKKGKRGGARGFIPNFASIEQYMTHRAKWNAANSGSLHPASMSEYNAMPEGALKRSATSSAKQWDASEWSGSGVGYGESATNLIQGKDGESFEGGLRTRNVTLQPGGGPGQMRTHIKAIRDAARSGKPYKALNARKGGSYSSNEDDGASQSSLPGRGR
jgi:hypothetical protein